MDYGIDSLPALVTGASRGIGRAVAEALARCGATVGLCARDEKRLQATAAEILEHGGRAIPLPCDLSDSTAVGALVGRAERALGGEMAILVVSHGTRTPMAKVHSLDPADTRAALAVDIEATLHVAHDVIPAMMGNRFGRLVFVGSASAAAGQGKAPLYSTVKAGWEGLARNLAIDFGKFGITANVVAPGFVDTERLHQRAPDPDQRRRLGDHAPVKRLAQPKEIADVVAFLCSRQASYLTGAVIPVTGGAHLMSLW